MTLASTELASGVSRWALLCVVGFAAIGLQTSSVSAADAAPASLEAATQTRPAAPKLPPPTAADVRYGASARNTLDFWLGRSDEPTPVVLYIHGGSWKRGDKSEVIGLDRLLAAGISVVSINYRFVDDPDSAGVSPPVRAPLYDAARALQFVRSHAKAWKIDSQRVGLAGTSAGACTSLWIAFHPDLADARRDDPIARESTRVTCVAANAPQTTLDPKQMKDWTPNSRYGGHAFGIVVDPIHKMSAFDVFLQSREKILPWIAEYSPYALASRDDPPVYLVFAAPPAVGKDQPDPTHTANFGVKLREKLEAVGVPCELQYPGAKDAPHPGIADYLINVLKRL